MKRFDKAANEHRKRGLQMVKMHKLTNNLNHDISLVISCWVSYSDMIEALIRSLCPFNNKAAQVLPGLHSHTPFSFRDLLHHTNVMLSSKLICWRCYICDF